MLILGTRGIPASHGGFETFAEYLALYLSSKGWSVYVYCQEFNRGNSNIREETWNGVTRVIVPVATPGSLGSIYFDLRSLKHALKKQGKVLILGYNTGIFASYLRAFGRRVVFNMDGIEWKRPKWPLLIRGWFRLNEAAAARIGTLLVADHPEIRRHLEAYVPSAKIDVIPYCADRISCASAEPLKEYGLEPDQYFITVCRIEPENSIYEIVYAFSQKSRNAKLVVLGHFSDSVEYHQMVRAVASPEVIFTGAIYDKPTVNSLRFHARAYCHGHTVGGTNPSLVEALGAGNAVIAHDNVFNRWTAGEEQCFFNDIPTCMSAFDEFSYESDRLRLARKHAVERFEKDFTVDKVLRSYEVLIQRPELL